MRLLTYSLQLQKEETGYLCPEEVLSPALERQGQQGVGHRLGQTGLLGGYTGDAAKTQQRQSRPSPVLSSEDMRELTETI